MSRNQTSNNVLNTAVVALVAAVVLILDQWSKKWVVAAAMRPLFYNGNCGDHPGHVVIPKLLCWTYTQNYHGAFGMFGSNAFLLVAMAIVVLVIFWFSFRDAAARSRLVRVAFGMIVGGAIGNILDRIHNAGAPGGGFVIDFIDFWRIWPNIFNVADSCITIGVGLLIISSLVTRRNR